MGAKAEEAGWERSTRRVGLGGPAHRWLSETDVPTELFWEVPANSGEKASYHHVCLYGSVCVCVWVWACVKVCVFVC